MLRVFCKTHSEIPLDNEIIKLMIRFLLYELKIQANNDNDHDNIIIITTIILYSQDLFIIDYPGLTLLIPSYIKIIEAILLSDKFNFISEEANKSILINLLNYQNNYIQFNPLRILKIAALNILKSIIAYGYIVPDMKISCTLNLMNEHQKTPNLNLSEDNKMIIVREKIFFITRRLIEKNERLRLNSKNDKIEYHHSEFCDPDFNIILSSIFLIMMYYESICISRGDHLLAEDTEVIF